MCHRHKQVHPASLSALLGSLMPPLSPGSDSYHQQPCPRGHYCPALSPAPLPCPPGTHGSSHFAKHPGDCQACPAGTFNHLPAQAACFPCGSSSSSQPGEFLCVSGISPLSRSLLVFHKPWDPPGGAAHAQLLFLCPTQEEDSIFKAFFPSYTVIQGDLSPEGKEELSSSTLNSLKEVEFHQHYFSHDLGGLC